MPARAMWKARLRLADLQVPVKLYAAINDTAVHFRLLHAADLAPVHQQMVDPRSNEPVAKADIRRGLEVDRGVFVTLTDDERAAVEPAPSRDIHIEQILDRSAVDLPWFHRPYYLGPNGDSGAYFALAEVLAKRDQVGIARWVMRKKSYHGALHARDGYLVLDTMRHVEEMVQLAGIAPEPSRIPDRRELDMATMLVETLEGEFDPAAYHDEYRERVMELIEAKAQGEEIELPAPAAAVERADLFEALEASLRASREAASGR